jgi:hypothetical protein
MSQKILSDLRFISATFQLMTTIPFTSGTDNRKRPKLQKADPSRSLTSHRLTTTLFKNQIVSFASIRESNTAYAVG